MRRQALIPLAVASALLLASCGDQPADDQHPPPADAAPDAPSDGAPNTPEAREAFDQRADEIARAWPDAAPSEADGVPGLWPLQGADPAAAEDDVLTLHVGHGDCDEDFGVLAEETEDVVIVAGWSTPDPDVEMCNEMLVVDPVDLPLDQPLGDRPVLDAVTGEEVASPPAP